MTLRARPSEPRYYLSNAPDDTSLETLAFVGASRWRIATEFETEKSDVGLDEYEIRTWAGGHHHITMCLLAGAFLLTLQQDWGKRCPRSPDPRFVEWSGSYCPKSSSGRESCCYGWRTSRNATNGADVPTRNAVPPSIQMPPAYLHNPSL